MPLARLEYMFHFRFFETDLSLSLFQASPGGGNQGCAPPSHVTAIPPGLHKTMFLCRMVYSCTLTRHSNGNTRVTDEKVGNSTPDAVKTEEFNLCDTALCSLFKAKQRFEETRRPIFRVK